MIDFLVARCGSDDQATPGLVNLLHFACKYGMLAIAHVGIACTQCRLSCKQLHQIQQLIVLSWQRLQPCMLAHWCFQPHAPADIDYCMCDRDT